MPTDLSTIDLATINAAHSVIVAALRNQCCQWEQDSADAAAKGFPSNAAMLEHWAFAADLLSATVSTEFSALFGKAVDARLSRSSARSVSDHLLDAMALEVAAQQSEQLDRVSV